MARPRIDMRCIGKGRCYWYDSEKGNIDTEGICGYAVYLHAQDKKFPEPKKIKVGKDICPFRDGMYNYYEPELI